MAFTERAKTIALAIVKIFETAKPFGNYSAVAVLKDGAGISYGANQFTHRSGSLGDVVKRYERIAGSLPTAVALAYPDLVARRNVASQSKNEALKAALRKLGKEPEMQQAQREVAFENYLWPAIKACEGSDFVLPLSLAVIYDSINHGSYDKIRDRVKFQRPSNGSIKPEEFEREWITEYVRHRDAWLEGHPNPLLRKTDYRTDFFLAQIARNNWQLKLPLNVHGYELTEAILFPSLSVSAAPSPESEPSLGPVTEPGQSSPSTGGQAPLTDESTPTPSLPSVTPNGTGDAPPSPFPQVIEMEAPAKDGSTRTAAKATVLGVGVPVVVATAIEAVQALVKDGYLDAKEVGAAVIKLIVNNQKYVLIVVGVFVGLLILKKIFKQVAFLVSMLTAAIPSWHTVVVTPQKAEESPKWWQIWK